MSSRRGLRFQQRIWLIPVLALLAFVAGVGVTLASNRAASVLVAVDEPTLQHVSDFARSLEDVRLALQTAAQEGDKRGLQAAQAEAERARAALAALRGVPGRQAVAAELSQGFESYWKAAAAAGALLLGSGNGDVDAAVRTMQAAQKAVQDRSSAALAQSRARFRASLAETSGAIDRGVAITTGIGIALALALSLLSWIIIRGVTRQLGAEPEAAARVVQRVASGDFSAGAIATRDGHSLIANVGQMQQALVEMLLVVRESSDQLLRAAEGIATGSEHLSDRTEQQAGSLEEAASSLEQVTATVQQTAENAQNLDALARDAAGASGEGGRVMADVIVTMDRIKGESARMTDIAGVIDGIAFQTNILALNAAVEAARAGEKGRGFAVVAQEVRALALRSSTSAMEIKQLLQASAASVDDGVARVRQAAATMDSIQRGIEQVVAIISDIAVASREQTAGLGSINGVVSQMEALTHDNARLAQQSVVSARDVRDRAEQLARAVSRFRLPQEGVAHSARPAGASGAPPAPLL